MRFDILLVASLLPAWSAATCIGYCAAKKAGGSSDTASLMSTDSNQKQEPKFDKNGNPVSPTGRVNDRCGSGKGGNNNCGCSSFTTITVQNDNEKVAKQDVLDLAARVRPGNHEWVVPTSGRLIVSYRTAGFFARAFGQSASVGNEDIADLCESSANEHATTDYVNVKGSYKQFVNEAGSMACDNPDHDKGIAVDVDWNISRVNKKDGPDSKQAGDKGDDNKF